VPPPSHCLFGFPFALPPNLTQGSPCSNRFLPLGPSSPSSSLHLPIRDAGLGLPVLFCETSAPPFHSVISQPRPFSVTQSFLFFLTIHCLSQASFTGKLPTPTQPPDTFHFNNPPPLFQQFLIAYSFPPLFFCDPLYGFSHFGIC